MNVYDIVINNELRVTSYELISLRVAFIARVTSYFLHRSYELLFASKLRVTAYWTSYKLLFTYELRVTVYYTNYELLLYEIYEFQLIARVTSYFLTMSNNEDEDDKLFMIISS